VVSISPDDDWFTCPVCGEEVQADALACPGCGADDETGWSEDAAYDDVDLPTDLDPPRRPPGPMRSSSMVSVVAVVLIVVILVLSLAGVW